jgi:hypothetical protein
MPTASVMERAARRPGKRWFGVALWTGREGLAASFYAPTATEAEKSADLRRHGACRRAAGVRGSS